MFKNLRGLVFGGRPTWSMGRVAFWLTFGLAYFKWIMGGDIAAGHQMVLMFVLTYVLGGKITAQKYGNKITGEKNLDE